MDIIDNHLTVLEVIFLMLFAVHMSRVKPKRHAYKRPNEKIAYIYLIKQNTDFAKTHVQISKELLFILRAAVH